VSLFGSSFIGCNSEISALCIKFLADESLKTGELERELLVTYDPAVIKELVPMLASKVGNNQAVYLTDKVSQNFL